MVNQLAHAQSPYLQQHATNPVEWREWGEEAFAEAAERAVPVLLSIGYAACHWCHVMAHESFEDPEIASVMNEHFVNIKVDREERPDVDAVYMEATQAMTGQGGWPMTCFLTPDGEPFHCGTYYPAAPLGGMPSFRQLLDAVTAAWTNRGAEVRNTAKRIAEQLATQRAPFPESTIDTEVLASAVSRLRSEFDVRNGGFGAAPKFPPSMVLEFLLRHHERTGAPAAREMVEAAAAAMARGGIYDQLAGGFARYSVDAQWVVPHFEKMLYDNALLLRFYAHLARRDPAPYLAGHPDPVEPNGQKGERGPFTPLLAERVVRETAEFLLRDLATAEGGFAASLDADTEGVEGLTYVWTRAELLDVLGAADGEWAADLFGVTEAGTFEHGASTLQLTRDPEDHQRWDSVRSGLSAARSRRPQPAIDDKIVTSWNGLAITALAEADAVLADGRFLDAAERAAELLLRLHMADGWLRRTSRHGVAGHAAGVLEDYGCLAEGLLTLHQATGAQRWLDAACALLDTALAQFADPDNPGVFFDTAADAESLIRRPSDPTDNASPAGASALASALLTASALAGASHATRYRRAAEQALSRAGVLAQRAPRFAGHWLAAAEALAHGPLQIAVAGEAGAGDRAALLAAARRHAPGGAVAVAGEPEASGVPLLAGRPLVAGAAAAYVCRGYVCDRPVTSVDELVAALSG